MGQPIGAETADRSAWVRRAWKALVPNYDQALSLAEARDHLVSLAAGAFDDSSWLAALDERMEAFPDFFARYDYSWCRDRACFDFPIETALQVRSIDAALGLWLADFADKPSALHLGRLTARTTYLARFEEATPFACPSEGLDFLVCPLGWTEFLHRFFAAFARAWPGGDRLEETWASNCQGDWLGIAANLIASTLECADYALPGMIKRIVAEVPEFSAARAEFSEVDENQTSRDLAYAAQDFALCHEVGHVAARDFSGPDELRADRWGVAAYFGSWGHRLPLHLEIARSDPLRASIGPFAFSCALRSLLAARVLISQRLGDDNGKSKRQLDTFRAVMARSRSLLAETGARTALFVRDPNDAEFRYEQGRVIALFHALARYEKAFGASLGSLSQAACIKARAAAEEASETAT